MGWPEDIHEMIKAIITECLDPNKERRVSAKELLEHPFFHIKAPEVPRATRHIDFSSNPSVSKARERGISTSGSGRPTRNPMKSSLGVQVMRKRLDRRGPRMKQT